MNKIPYSVTVTRRHFNGVIKVPRCRSGASLAADAKRYLALGQNINKTARRCCRSSGSTDSRAI